MSHSPESEAKPVPGTMSQERWVSLMDDPNGRITEAEMAAGWHWCWDYDGLLVGPGMPEMKNCGCIEGAAALAGELVECTAADIETLMDWGDTSDPMWPGEVSST